MGRDSQEEIKKLYMEHYTKMFSFALAVLQDPTQAEDAVHEAFIAALMKYDNILWNHPNQIGWLIQTLKHKLQEIKRRNYRDQVETVSVDALSGSLADPGPDMETNLMLKSFSLESVQRVLEPDDFLLIKKVYLDGTKCAVAAKELGITTDACYKRLARAKHKLRMHFAHLIDRR